jgi:hypothetical protein
MPVPHISDTERTTTTRVTGARVTDGRAHMSASCIRKVDVDDRWVHGLNM